jgi:L-aspartate oxidase
VITDTSGQTDLDHLFAIGEVACTGLHGANRLASNSLLECIVSALSASSKIKEDLSYAVLQQIQDRSNMPWYSDNQDIDNKILFFTNQIKEIIWQEVSIIRSNHSLTKAQKALALIEQEVDRLWTQTQWTPSLIELRNLALIACLIVQSALLRCECRGTHYNVDYATNRKMLKDTDLAFKTE